MVFFVVSALVAADPEPWPSEHIQWLRSRAPNQSSTGVELILRVACHHEPKLTAEELDALGDLVERRPELRSAAKACFVRAGRRLPKKRLPDEESELLRRVNDERSPDKARLDALSLLEGSYRVPDAEVARILVSLLDDHSKTLRGNAFVSLRYYTGLSLPYDVNAPSKGARSWTKWAKGLGKKYAFPRPRF